MSYLLPDIVDVNVLSINQGRNISLPYLVYTLLGYVDLTAITANSFVEGGGSNTTPFIHKNIPIVAESLFFVEKIYML